MPLGGIACPGRTGLDVCGFHLELVPGPRVGVQDSTALIQGPFLCRASMEEL